MRKLKTLGIVAGVYLVAIFMETVMTVSSPDYQGGMSVLVIGASFSFMATKVGYRWFDAFLVLTPIYGIYFIFKIAYRIAYLPQRDWSNRGEESGSAN
jgi:hypothetical protein